MNASQQIADWLVAQGIEQIFSVTGGGTMFLNHALGTHPRLRCTYMHHEQACAMAAEGYARITGKPAVVNVTTGPGGINALNGVYGAWTDSVPMLILSGQVKRETCLDFVSIPGLRQLGDQEGPVIHMAKSICKFAEIARSAGDLATLLPQAFTAAITGRPGPAWIDIPLDVQSANIPLAFEPVRLETEKIPDGANSITAILHQLHKSNRPLILAGSGVRIGNATEQLLEFAELAGIPVATAWTHDLIASDHPLFAGRPGTIGTRAGNFCLQSADCVLVIGSRLNIRQVSYNWQAFAKNAFVIQIDIDPAEFAKPFVRPQLVVHADAGKFLSAITAEVTRIRQLPNYSAWATWCHSLQTRFPTTQQPLRNGQPLNPYAVVEHIFRRLRHSDMVVCGNASACIIPFQVGHLQEGQRMFSNSGAASMGYDLPAAIGAAMGSMDRRVVCFAGDGSLQMNIQELQTLETSGANVVVVVLANGGYLSIRQTHENFFGSIIGANSDSGVDLPDFSAIAKAYGLKAIHISRFDQFAEFDDALQENGPLLIHVDVDPAQGFEPRIKSRILPDGKFATPELDDMFPFLSPNELSDLRNEAAELRAVPVN
jgi:acetolactate synthase-1/2/3 large subunit